MTSAIQEKGKEPKEGNTIDGHKRASFILAPWRIICHLIDTPNGTLGMLLSDSRLSRRLKRQKTKEGKAGGPTSERVGGAGMGGGEASPETLE